MSQIECGFLHSMRMYEEHGISIIYDDNGTIKPWKKYLLASSMANCWYDKPKLRRSNDQGYLLHVHSRNTGYIKNGHVTIFSRSYLFVHNL